MLAATSLKFGVDAAVTADTPELRDGAATGMLQVTDSARAA